MTILEGGKIDSRQLLALLVLTRLLAALIDAPSISGTSIGHDAWLAIVLSTLLAIPWGLLIVRLSSMFPRMTIIQYSQTILGPWLGRLVGLLIILSFIQQSALTVRIGSSAYVTAISPETPLLVFIGIITFLSANAARSGLEVVARASSVTFVVTLVMLGLLLVLPLNTMDFANLLPVMARGWPPLQNATLFSFSVFGELLVVTMLTPYLNRPQEAGRFVVYAILLSGFFFTWLAIAVAAVFGPAMSSLIMPAFSLGRLIQFALIVERVEVIPLVAWTISTGTKQALFLWAAMLGIAQWFNLSEMRSLAYPVGALIAAFALWIFKNSVEKADFVSLGSFGTLGLVVSVGIPVLLYGVNSVRGVIRHAMGKEE